MTPYRTTYRIPRQFRPYAPLRRPPRRTMMNRLGRLVRQWLRKKLR
jgi:hypothetical protein